MSEQPMPVPGRVDVTPVARSRFLEMLAQRERKGIATYGTTPQTHNGRNVLLDLAEEIIDAWQYVVQAGIEHDDMIRENAALRAENDALRAALEGGRSGTSDGRVGARIKDARAATGITQAALARRAGIQASHLNAIEHGRTEPKRATLLKVARALSLTSTEAREILGLVVNNQQAVAS